MGIALCELIFDKPDRPMQKIIADLLDLRTLVRLQLIAKTAISLLKKALSINQRMMRDKNETINRFLENYLPKLMRHTLLMKLMCLTPPTDLNPDLGHLLKVMRREYNGHIANFMFGNP